MSIFNRSSRFPHGSPQARASSSWALFSLAAFATIFDSFFSWLVIDSVGIAEEGNGLWNSVAETVGFGGAMIVRALLGIVLLVALLLLALKSKAVRARKFAYVGLWIAAIVLVMLCCYHLSGIFSYLNYS